LTFYFFTIVLVFQNSILFASRCPPANDIR
jgi:hypothetical protein